MDIVAGITGAITLAKQLLELKGLTRNAQALTLIADLQVRLATVNIQLAALLEENQRLKAELAKRETPDLVFNDFGYYKVDGDGPYCPTCYDRDRVLCRILEVAPALRPAGRYRCATCKGRFHPRS